MICSIGVDPDLHTTAFAVVCDEPVRGNRVYATVVARSPTTAKGYEAVIQQAIGIQGLVEFFKGVKDALSPSQILLTIESPKHYPGDKKSNPADLINLAHISGMALACLLPVTTSGTLVSPKDWKGDTPKTVNQARSYATLEEPCFEAKGGYMVPERLQTGMYCLGAAHLNRGDWKHMGDAIGLALYGLKRAARPGRFDQAKSVAQRNRM